MQNKLIGRWRRSRGRRRGRQRNAIALEFEKRWKVAEVTSIRSSAFGAFEVTRALRIAYVDKEFGVRHPILIGEFGRQYRMVT